MKRFILQFLFLQFLLIISESSYSQPIDTSEAVFEKSIKSVAVRNPDNFMLPPMMRLGTDDRITVNFDLIGEDPAYLKCRLIHCNADWKKSSLAESEYLEGFNEYAIDDYAYSSNTYVHYVNYNVEIPNDDLRITRSGNYLLQVYPEDDPDNVWLQVRFYATDNSLQVRGILTSRTDKGYNTEYQQIAVETGGGTNKDINPYQDMIVTVMQNNRPETMKTTTHPLRVSGNTIVFDHDPAFIFRGNDEYRRFETVRTDYPGIHVDSVKFGGSNWHAYLAVDESRKENQYTYDRTQHGRFLIKDYNSDDPDLGADYVTVHFTLDSPRVMGGKVYVDGDFTLHQFDDSNLMKYNIDNGLYEAWIPLKQGSYNYQYVVVPETGGEPDPYYIEGSKYETSNEYLIQVFLRRPGERADRLVGFDVVGN